LAGFAALFAAGHGAAAPVTIVTVQADRAVREDLRPIARGAVAAAVAWAVATGVGGRINPREIARDHLVGHLDHQPGPFGGAAPGGCGQRQRHHRQSDPARPIGG
jgi:hypothetical protein